MFKRFFDFLFGGSDVARQNGQDQSENLGESSQMSNTSQSPSRDLDWHRVADRDQLPEGRVMSVTAGVKTLALVHFDGQYAAMDNRCPHQGGPLGEGSIEKGVDGQCWLRCPWHGWDFDPITGKPPGGHEDTGQTTYPVEVRADGIYVGVPPEPAHVPDVSDVMVGTMVNWGVKRVFGMVGHSNLGLAEAFRKREESGDISYVGIRHEGAASFACSGYAKLSGRPAACLSIAGPGATNLLTGLWDAKVDRAPVIACTGQVQTQVFSPFAFQDIDLLAAFKPVAAFSHMALPDSNPGELATLAMKTAIVERDVAHLVFPDDVQTIKKPDARPGAPAGRLSSVKMAPDPESVAKAVQEIRNAERPLIIVGYGARQAMDKVVGFAETLKCPVLTTFKGKGQIPDTHPNAGGVLGRSGTPIASWFMNECDLIIALGASFSHHTGIEPKKKIVQVDFDRMHLGKGHPVAVPVWGELGVTLAIMSDELGGSFAAKDQLGELSECWTIWRREKESRLSDDRGRGVSAASLFAAMTRVVPKDAVMPVDVGNNTYSFGRYFEPCGQSVLMSGYLGSIGFGFPAAMGAWAATQDFPEYHGRKVVSVSGDGGFGQYAMEFTTAVHYNMDITHILMNNCELGKISKEQRSGEWRVWQTDLTNPSFATFAESCGGLGVRVDRGADLESAISRAIAHDGPALVEVMTDAELV
jgi:thiamine pyrophosphate-dependent acetolactate synthase large subunit-like protein/nitrite reductase/ring-hydroxylating ferredoxin subunit